MPTAAGTLSRGISLPAMGDIFTCVSPAGGPPAAVGKCGGCCGSATCTGSGCGCGFGLGLTCAATGWGSGASGGFFLTTTLGGAGCCGSAVSGFGCDWMTSTSGNWVASPAAAGGVGAEGVRCGGRRGAAGGGDAAAGAVVTGAGVVAAGGGVVAGAGAVGGVAGFGTWTGAVVRRVVSRRRGAGVCSCAMALDAAVSHTIDAPVSPAARLPFVIVRTFPKRLMSRR